LSIVGFKMNGLDLIGGGRERMADGAPAGLHHDGVSRGGAMAGKAISRYGAPNCEENTPAAS
jgi:hypothetical protein